MTVKMPTPQCHNLNSSITIEQRLRALLELTVSVGCIPPNDQQVRAVLHQLEQLYFPRPSWAAGLDDILIDWMDLFLNERAGFEALRNQASDFNFNTLYWADEISPELSLQYLTPDSSFMQHNGLIARVLTTMLQQDMYIVRFKPEYFALHNGRINCSWETLGKDALSINHRQLNKMEVGWMHGALRKLELPANVQPAAMVTHTFAYNLLYTLTRLPTAQHQGALLEQIDRFRLYNPLLTSELRNFWRHYLQLPTTSLETPQDCWQAFQTIVSHLTHTTATDTVKFDIGGDSVYGRRKGSVGRSTDNEDIFFYLAEEGAAILGVADGVSTSDIGRGRLASHAIKQVIDDQEPELRQQLQQFASQTGDISGQQLLLELFQDCQQAVLTEINACARRTRQETESRHPMSSTLVVAIIVGNTVTIGHWGDSRAYKISGVQVIRLTEDHNLRNELLTKKRNLVFEPLAKGAGAELNRVVGQCHFDHKLQEYVSDEPRVSIDSCQLAPGDYLLLCTDGLLNINDVTGEVDAEQFIKQNLDEYPGETCREIARQLVRKADDAHGVDNITALLLRLSGTLSDHETIILTGMANMPHLIMKPAMPVSLSPSLSRKRARERTNRCASFTLKSAV